MAKLTSIWNRAVTSRRVSLSISAAVIVLSVLLIAIGEVQELGWTRLIGAGMISLFSVIFGILVGWSDRIRPVFARVFSNWSRAIVALLAAIIVAPLIAGLVLSFGGLIVGGASADWHLMLAGVLIVILLLGLTLATAATALSLAFEGLWRTRARDQSRSNGQDEK